MRKQNGDVEMIEVFAPDDAPLWADSSSLGMIPTDAPTGDGSSRRGVVFGVLAVVAAIVAVLALSDDNSTESAATTTIAATPTTQRPSLDPGGDTTSHYLIDDPSLTAYSADIVTPPSEGEQVQVWTNGLPIGPIVTLELHPHPFEPYGIVGATRDVVEGIELVRPTAEPDTTISEVPVDDDWSVTVRATRLQDSKVAQVVRGIQVIDGKLAENSDVMAALSLGRTFEDDSLDDLIYGRVESAVRYLTADGQVATLRSATGISANRLAGVRYLVDNAQMFYYDSMYGRLPGTGEVIVVWENDGRLLSLVAPGDPIEIIRLSKEVRAATDDEWTSMVYGLRPDYTLGDFETLATGHASNAELWRAGPQIAERGGFNQYLWWWTVPALSDVTASTATSSAVGLRPTFDTLVVPGATFVFVSRPGVEGTATVRSAGGVEFVAKLVKPFSESLVYMSVVRIEEPGPVTVSIDGVDVTQ